MSNKRKFLPLPIYSIAVFGKYLYFSGGGGGSTGIPNQILIYDGTKGNIATADLMKQEPVNRISTGSKFIDNLTIYDGQAQFGNAVVRDQKPNNSSKSFLACTEAQNVVIYKILQEGRNLQRTYLFQSDYSPKHPTVNALCFNHDGTKIAAGGDDTVVRFYDIENVFSDDPLIIKSKQLFKYQQHKSRIRNIDHNFNNLFLSSDTQTVVIYDYQKKGILRVVYADQLEPIDTQLQAAYFTKIKGESLTFVHFRRKDKTYISKQIENIKNKKNGYKMLASTVVSDDQSCLSAYNSQLGLLGISCGRGNTFIFDAQGLNQLSSQKGHDAVITANIITKRGKYVTGTSQCSYHAQEMQFLGQPAIRKIFFILLTVLITIGIIFLLTHPLLLNWKDKNGEL